MANQEHLEILKQGVDVWNKWRKEKWRIKPNLSNAKLQNTNFHGISLHGVNLQYADLQGSDFRNANFRKSNFRRANLRMTDLQKADFQEADLQRANLRRSNLEEADLQGADLRRSELQGANITGTCLFFTQRDFWIIKNIRCDYFYCDDEGMVRTPKDRNFRPGEFEELYKWRPLNKFENLIQRSIEFPEEYFEAGKSILSFFGTILRKKYNDNKSSVQIKQEGLKVTMIIDPAGGDRETIEKYLDDYGLMITGNITPEEYTDDRLLLIELKSELRSAQTKLEVQRELLVFKEKEHTNRIISLERELALFKEKEHTKRIISLERELALFKEKEHTKRIISLEEEVKWLREHIGCILQHSERVTENLGKMPAVIKIENKLTIGGDRAAIINGNVNGNAITGNGNKVAGNDSQIGDHVNIHANDVSYAADQAKVISVKNSQAGIVGDSAEVQGGTEFQSRR